MRPLAIVTTHPIQYQAPLFRYLVDRGIPLRVLFLSDFALRGNRDPGFGVDVKWDIPLLEGYEYEFLPSLRRDPHPGDGFFSMVNPAVAARLSRKSYSAVMVHGYRNASLATAIATAVVRRLPVLYRSESHSRGRPASSRKTRAARLMFGRISAFLSIGTLNDEFYAAHGVPAQKRFLTPYAVDNERFRAEAERSTVAQARTELGLPADKKVILFSGKFQPWKRPDLLLDAFNRLDRADSHLVYVGDGELRAGLERRAGDRVTFLGFLNQSQISLAYRSADVLVLPSEHEPWGLVVNEAMNFGVPAVVSDVVGCGPDLVEGAGKVFRSGDVYSLTDALSEVLDDRNLETFKRAASDRIARWGFEGCYEGLTAALNYVGAR